MRQPNLAPIVVSSTDVLSILVREHIAEHGMRVNLNHLDVSGVTSMCGVFRNLKFQGDISHWNTTNVEDFGNMFYGSTFNQDISAIRNNVWKVIHAIPR